ncbi:MULTISPECIES: GNAT family N-acetyltransferase [Streptomyces]|uniref:GNAT family N-acetyltransferase n=1 Tax=Streptomyces TaxID=1883 RepID=UPI00163CBABA|nr:MULTISPECIES: GNAT family N-acetyltransferase [Streptomyces]MBC2877081.1 GNAT family N-acetyltransferase [Streptomyces sp. TYQ1024]UBI39355.1 GNAT family N-acetyltransferase [Streptomyces mobaraensis]UKW31935.1 GNAT family N-acetyltransferase [Streptomyces sp. TYQ1024]
MSGTPARVPAQVRVVAGPGELEDCFAVRREVFVGEQNIPEAEELDAYDVHAVHLLATGPSGPVGTVRFLHGEPARRKYAHAGVADDLTAVLGRLAVGRAARGTGLGAALVRAVEEEARRLGLARVYLEAQTHALGFYERLGYAAFGPEFDEGSGIPHRAMSKAL